MSGSKTLAACCLLLVACLALLPQSSAATPIAFFGADSGNNDTANSDQSFAAWSAAVGDFRLDDLDGLSGAAGFGGNLTSAIGNTFSTPDDLISRVNFGNVGVLQGENLRLTRVGPTTSFTWDLVEPAAAFGFFGRNNDGGIVTIAFDDGSVQELDMVANSSNSTGDNLFFGVTNLAGAVSSVTIESTDPGTGSNGGNSHWDRFVTAPAPAAVPEPGAAGLYTLGLAAFAMARRNRIRWSGPSASVA